MPRLAFEHTPTGIHELRTIKLRRRGEGAPCTIRAMQTSQDINPNEPNGLPRKVRTLENRTGCLEQISINRGIHLVRADDVIE